LKFRVILPLRPMAEGCQFLHGGLLESRSQVRVPGRHHNRTMPHELLNRPEWNAQHGQPGSEGMSAVVPSEIRDACQGDGLFKPMPGLLGVKHPSLTLRGLPKFQEGHQCRFIQRHIPGFAALA